MIYVHQAVPITQIQVAFHVGSWDEPEGLEGCASLALGMLETGTETLSRRAFESRLDALGAHFSSNATMDYSVVSVEVLSDKLDAAFALLSDVLLRPAFDAGEFERLRRLQRQEILAAQDDDRAVGGRLFRQFMFRYKGYARPTSGTLASLDRLSNEEVRGFYRDTLLRAPVLLGVTSDQPRERFEALQGDLGLPWSDEPATVAEPEAETRGGLRVLLIDKPERSQCQAFLGARGPSGKMQHTIPLSVGNTVLGGSFTSRLMQEIREKRGLSYGVGSSLSLFRRDGLFQVRFFPNAEKVLETLEIAQQVLDTWIREGVTAEEVSFAKEYLTNQFHFRSETPASELNQHMVYRLAGRPPEYLDTWLDELKSVAVPEVNRAVKARFEGARWYVGIVATVTDELKEQFRETMKPDQFKVVTYTEELLA